MTATDLTEQTQRISGRIEAAKAALVVFCPGKEQEAETLVRAFMEVLIEAMSSATVLAAQAVLPAYAQAEESRRELDILAKFVARLNERVLALEART